MFTWLADTKAGRDPACVAEAFLCLDFLLLF